MEKVQRYNAIIAYLTVLPIVTALPMLILWQGVLWYCIAKMRCLRRVAGIQADSVSARKELELYYFHDSCCCQKVKLALEEVGLAAACHHKHLDIGRYGRYDHLKDAHLKRNPMATVPVLVHKGRPILDATSQIRYVEEALDGNASLVPPTEHERARMEIIINQCDIDPRPRVLTNFADSWGNAVQLFSLQNISFSHRHYGLRKSLYALVKHPNPMIPMNRILFNLLHIRIEPSVSREALERIEQATREYDALLADGRTYLCGQIYTLADIACLPLLHRLQDLGIMEHVLLRAPTKRSLLNYWMRLRDRPSSKKVFNEWEPKSKIQKAVHTAVRKHRDLALTVGVYGAFIPEA